MNIDCSTNGRLLLLTKVMNVRIVRSQLGHDTFCIQFGHSCVMIEPCKKSL